ncbi:carbohydrate-binding protein [Aquimarina sp. RZ0]|uniref:carbohydrate-binding protein n=1 Tax=Aquimarina sp. RZ0 TaxID=2607730 RepID=UPI0011F0DDF1|nr:carbohydrate-binding protein [Aquimarina sp. RZ0]KAA1248034.1 carbohydrate-binding protein [Aquimarina sp. RZ0]
MKNKLLLGLCLTFICTLAYAQPAAPSGKKWEKVNNLSDEFNGGFDGNKWEKVLWDYPNTPTKMIAENSGVSGGNLWIKATLDNNSARWFQSSRIYSKAQIKYPMYTESRIITAHLSAYNTFWMNNGDINSRDEIDIIENNSRPSCGCQPDFPWKMNSQYFQATNGFTVRNEDNFDNRNLPNNNPKKGVRWNEEYHTVGVWWKDSKNMTFYLDGEEAGSVRVGEDRGGITYPEIEFTRNLNLIWDLWTADETWLGGLAVREHLTNNNINTMKVDWVHTYKLVNDNGGGGNIPVTSVTVSDSNVILSVNETRDLDATVRPNNASNKSVSWSSNNNAVARVNSNGLVTAVSEGVATITVTTQDGNKTATSRITVNDNTPPPPPPSGDTIVIEAENFTNTDGTFNDASTGGPGFGVNAGGNRINYVNSGDYAEYEINVGTAGNYRITYQISTPSNNAQIQLLIDNTIVATDNVPNNGDWEDYNALVSSSTISNLSAGRKTVRIVASGSNQWQWNLDKITLERISTSPPPPPGGGNATLVIEAEDFVDTSGTFNDASTGGPGLGVNRVANNINYVNNGDWAEYRINVPTAGSYAVEYLISTPSNGSQIQLIAAGATPLTTNVPNNGGWDDFTSLVANDRINLSAGAQTLRILASSNTVWQWNLDKIILSRSSTRDSGINSSNEQQLSLYPNPASDIVFIQGLSGKAGKTQTNVRVFDIKGTQFIDRKLGKDHTIDIGSLPQGIYFVQLIGTDEVRNLKIIKE